MQALKRSGILLALIAAAGLSALADAKSDATLALLRQRLSNAVGETAWNRSEGYALEGRFILKATGEEITYRARYARASNRWVADYSQEDPARNLRYAFSGKGAWAASAEVTLDLKPEQLPYMARFDFYQLYDALLGILERGMRSPDFAAAAAANEIHISGKLPNGWDATFVFNIVEYLPRKVVVTPQGKATSAWLLPFAKPNGSGFLLHTPGISAEFEIWFSDPVDAGGHRYPQRMDFVEGGNVVGTFFLEKSMPIAEAEALFRRPPDFPWAEALRLDPGRISSRRSAYLDSADLPEFRRRMTEKPWSGWSRENRLFALWAILVPWIGRIVPHSLSFRLVLLTAAMLFAGIAFLLLRRRRQTGDRFRWEVLLAGFFVCCLILPAWCAAYQLHTPQARSLLALHAAVRYAITGQSFYAGRAASLLSNFQREAPAQSMEDLGHACQAYALAYDIIRSGLAPDRQIQIAEDLFGYAKPLFGASHGWASNTHSSGAISAGLGMAGLAIAYEPYITAAREGLDKMLESQLINGLHQSGPGAGNRAMDSAVNLFYGLKKTGRADYYANAAFREYLDTTLQLLSPVGTLPLFGNTSLDQADRLSAFFLKTANHVPGKAGRECLAAYDRYWAYGRYHAGGWVKWFLPAIQSLRMTFANPHIFLQHTQDLPFSSLRASSAILGDGQCAVLRSGEDPDSAYLALNMTRSNHSAHRDILTFDLYAYGSLLLHGPGFPGADHADYQESAKTAASNSITFHNEDQSSIRCTGIESSLLNQPIFDYVRAQADKTYDHGHVQRDAILVRSEKDQAAYFLLLDDVYTNSPETSVQWHLHGRGNLATGIGQSSRWTTTRFDPPRLWPKRIVLEAHYAIGTPEKLSQKSGKLHAQISLLALNSESTVIEWTGSKRFGCILTPRRFKEASEKIHTLGEGAIRIGDTDWVSIGSRDAETAIGPLNHVSEYVIVRDRRLSFPALLMVSGRQCRFGPHSLLSSKPVTASLKGLRGGFLNSHPGTHIELRTPSIRAGDRFGLDDKIVAAAEPGVLRLTLEDAGEHSLHPSN